MSASIIHFPTDRCRQPATAIEAAERAAYDRAAERFAIEPGHGPSITAMMELSCEGACDVARPLAATWLLAQLGLLMRDEAA